MATYRVGLMQQIWEECSVVVDADTPEKAQDMALQMALDGDVEWQFSEANEPPQIGGIEKEEPDQCMKGTLGCKLGGHHDNCWID